MGPIAQPNIFHMPLCGPVSRISIAIYRMKSYSDGMDRSRARARCIIRCDSLSAVSTIYTCVCQAERSVSHIPLARRRRAFDPIRHIFIHNDAATLIASCSQVYSSGLWIRCWYAVDRWGHGEAPPSSSLAHIPTAYGMHERFRIIWQRDDNEFTMNNLFFSFSGYTKKRKELRALIVEH